MCGVKLDLRVLPCVLHNYMTGPKFFEHIINLEVLELLVGASGYPCVCTIMKLKNISGVQQPAMWRSQLGAKEVKTITQADDDDWDTDPDFVVSYLVVYISV